MSSDHDSILCMACTYSNEAAPLTEKTYLHPGNQKAPPICPVENEQLEYQGASLGL
jgi:hypothetical protein